MPQGAAGKTQAGKAETMGRCCRQQQKKQPPSQPYRCLSLRTAMAIATTASFRYKPLPWQWLYVGINVTREQEDIFQYKRSHTIKFPFPFLFLFIPNGELGQAISLLQCKLAIQCQRIYVPKTEILFSKCVHSQVSTQFGCTSRCFNKIMEILRVFYFCLNFPSLC